MVVKLLIDNIFIERLGFRQLLFSLFSGDQRENSKSLPRVSIVFLNFSLWSPLWNNENKSCLNELKSARIPQPVAKVIWSFWSILANQETLTDFDFDDFEKKKFQNGRLKNTEAWKWKKWGVDVFDATEVAKRRSIGQNLRIWSWKKNYLDNYNPSTDFQFFYLLGVTQSYLMQIKIQKDTDQKNSFAMPVKNLIALTTYSWNIKWQKCTGMGHNGFIFKKVN